MKKIFLSLCLCAAALTGFAQEGPGLRSSTDYAPGSSNSRNNGFGIKGGYNLTNVRGDNRGSVGGRENLNTFHAGVYAQLGFNDKWSLQPELLYSRKGFRYDAAGTQRVNRLDYLQLPILAVYNITDNFSLHLGPQVALLTKIKRAGADLDISSSGFRSLDYGAVGGAEFRAGPARLGARYDLSLAKLVKNSNSIASTDNKIYNQAFQVYLGLGIGN